MKTKFKIHSGFTLVELLVVISIIAVLSTIGLTTYQGIQSKARDSIRKNDLNKLAIALELYTQQHHLTYIDGTPGVEGDCTSADTTTFYHPTNGIAPYMSNNIVSTDPQSKNNYCYISVNNGQSFRLFAKLENCSDPNIIPGISCATADYNYSITSDDLIASAPPPTPTPTPTTTPSVTPVPFARVFVTSQTFTGNLGGLSGADAKCQQRANAANLGGTWKAWLSDRTTSAASRLTHSTQPYKTVKGNLVASNWSDLVDGSLLFPIQYDESGNFMGNDYLVHTGTKAQGQSFDEWETILNMPDNRWQQFCANWTSTDLRTSLSGHSIETDGRWTNRDVIVGCHNTLALYCFEQ